MKKAVPWDLSPQISGVSVAVFSYQAEDRLGFVLKALLEQQDPGVPWELLLVDNNSLDQTVALASRTWSNLEVPLRIFQEAQPGVGHSRVRALENARYPLLALLDDDTVPTQDWLFSVMRHFQSHPETTAVAGYNSLDSLGHQVPEWFEEVKGSWAVGPASEQETASTLWTAGLVVRTQAWNTLCERGFKQKLTGRTRQSKASGEDTEFTLALSLTGHILRYEPSLRLAHRIPPNRLTLSYARSLYQGFGQASIWTDAYWRANWADSSWKNFKRRWVVQATAEFLRAAFLRLRLLFSRKKRVPRLLEVEYRLARFLELIRVRTEYERFQRAIILAPWRVS